MALQDIYSGQDAKTRLDAAGRGQHDGGKPCELTPHPYRSRRLAPVLQ